MNDFSTFLPHKWTGKRDHFDGMPLNKDRTVVVMMMSVGKWGKNALNIAYLTTSLRMTTT